MEQNEQQSGIFEPREIDHGKLPLTGTQIAKRIVLAIVILLLAALLYVMLKAPYMKPVKTFYSGIEKKDVVTMCEAFPTWLVTARSTEESATVADMCTVVLNLTRVGYGADVQPKASEKSKKEIEQSYLEKLQNGIKAQYGIDAEITKGYSVKIGVAFENHGSIRSVDQYVRIYKIDGKWVLLDVPSDTE